MAITINGNGTITGYTPTVADGSITSAKLANGAASGSKLTMPSGSIVQTKSFIFTSVTESHSGQGYHATSITKQITPTSASNKILVMATLSAGNGGGVGEGAAFKVMRSVAGGSYAETVALGDSVGNCTRGAVGGLYDENEQTHTDCRSIQFVDTPNTTSAVDYKIYAYVFDSSQPILINRPNTTTAGEHITGTSSLILMEIAA